MSVQSTGMVLSVFVPTFRRPHLLLKALESLRLQTDCSPFTIVVVDNDFERKEGALLTQQWALDWGLQDRIRTAIVPKKGLSVVRNAGLSLAFSDNAVTAVAMMDDDAEAYPDWLAEIKKALEVSNAIILGGPTIYKLDTETPTWIAQADMFKVPFSKSGVVGRLRSTNNCTVTRALYNQLGPDLFDSAFNMSGGEDVHLFRRCQQRALVSYWSSEAKVSEGVPPERSTEQWVLKRHRNSATNIARIERSIGSPIMVIAMQLSAAFREGLSGTLRLLSRDPVTRFLGRMRVVGAIGRIEGLSGNIPKHQAN